MSEMFKKTYRGYLIDHHSPAPPIVTLDKIDIHEYEKFYKEANINNLMVYCKDHWGYTYYDTKIGKRHPGLKEDWVEKIRPVLKKNNIEFNAYYCMEYDNYAPTSHPEWRIQKANGEALRCSYSKASWHMPCYETGYRDYVLEQIFEIVTGYKPDSLFLDIFGKSLCYCSVCRNKFKDKYGYALPEDEQGLSKAFTDVSNFLNKSSKDMLEEIVELAKGIDPDIKVTINFAALYPKEIRDMLDYQFTEPWAGNWLSAAYARDTAHMQYPQLGPGNVSDVYNFKPVSRYILAASQIAAQGCRVFMYSGSQFPDGTLEHEESGRIGTAYREVECYENLLMDRQVLADIAIIQSDLSTGINVSSSIIPNAIARVKAGSSHRTALLGAMKLCDYSKYGWKVLPEQDVNRKSLKNIKVVLLPDVYHINTSLFKTLKDFTVKGGILITSGETGMYDKQGNKLDEWLLRDIAGVNFIGKDSRYSNNDWSGYLKIQSPPLTKYIPNTSPPVNEVRYLIEKEEAASLAYFIDPAAPVSSEIWVNWWSPPPSKETKKPAIVLNRYKMGYVYYSAFDLFKLANEDFPWVSGLFHGLLEKCLPNPVIHLATDSPHLIGIVSYYRKREIIIHLVSSLAEKAEGDVVPIKGGWLRISEADFLVDKVRIVYPEEKLLPLKRSDGAVNLMVPGITIHTILEVTVQKK